MAEHYQTSEEAQILITFWKRHFAISDVVLQNNTVSKFNFKALSFSAVIVRISGTQSKVP